MPSPLDIMLETMNRRWAAGDEDAAVQLAKAAAPYVHPRAQHRATPDLQECSDDELQGPGTGAADPAAPEF